MFGLGSINSGLALFPEINLQVLVLSINPMDDPSIWENYMDFVENPNFNWGVVSSNSFTFGYEIYTLGPIFLVDPDGIIVFRSNHPLPVWQFEILFELTTQQ